MSKKKNDEEKEVKTEAQNQEESKTDAEDKKAEAKEKENPLEKELKDTKQFRKSLPRLIISKERLQMSRRITRDLKKVFK